MSIKNRDWLCDKEGKRRDGECIGLVLILLLKEWWIRWYQVCALLIVEMEMKYEAYVSSCINNKRFRNSKM